LIICPHLLIKGEGKRGGHRDKKIKRESYELRNREGWPLPTVEIQENEDSKGTNDRGSSLVDSLDLSFR
jgi:hypothetical protein